MKKITRQQIYDKFGGKCAYTGKPLGDDWQIDHIISKGFALSSDGGYLYSDINSCDNLFPSLRIVNHYKRDLDLEGFRVYMLSFHKRLAKLPRNTMVGRTIRRKEYMYKVADAFGITPENPFCGTFYFETLK